MDTATVSQTILTAAALTAIAVATIPLVIIDIREHRLPNRITYSLAAITLLCAAGASNFTAVGCGLVSAIAMLLLSLLSRGGLGMGDVKLAVSLGTAAGLFGTATTVMTFTLAFIVGGIWALWGLATRRFVKQSSLPFGPALLAGFWLSIIGVML